MNVGYKLTPYNYNSSTAPGLGCTAVSKVPLFLQKHCPAKFSGHGPGNILKISQSFTSNMHNYYVLAFVHMCIHPSYLALYNTFHMY